MYNFKNNSRSKSTLKISTTQVMTGLKPLAPSEKQQLHAGVQRAVSFDDDNILQPLSNVEFNKLIDEYEPWKLK